MFCKDFVTYLKHYRLTTYVQEEYQSIATTIDIPRAILFVWYYRAKNDYHALYAQESVMDPANGCPDQIFWTTTKFDCVLRELNVLYHTFVKVYNHKDPDNRFSK